MKDDIIFEKINNTEIDMLCKQNDINRISRFEECFPKRLLDINVPPTTLYYKGFLPDEDALSVAVIGARECTSYGSDVAIVLGEAIAESGFQLISGLARGIDSISQRAALRAGGATFGIMGCGVDVCYPPENRGLYEDLCRGESHGGIISEYPPGTLPLGKLFPQRNRIVSGLSDVVVVIEARMKSGTSITVDHAIEQGKDVYVVPGRIDDMMSYGCNKLLYQGANVIYSMSAFMNELKDKQDYLKMVKRDRLRNDMDVMKKEKIKNEVTASDIKAFREDVRNSKKKKRDDLAKELLSEEEYGLYSILDRRYFDTEDIMDKYRNKFRRSIPVHKMMTMLSSIEYKGLAESDGGFYRLASSP